MRLFCLRLAALLLLFFGPSGGAAETGEVLRVATYNLRNSLVMDRVVEGKWRPD